MKLQRRTRRIVAGYTSSPLIKTKIDKKNKIKKINWNWKWKWRIGDCTDELNGEGNGEAFIDMNGGDVGETGSDELNKEVGGTGGADADGGSGEAFEAEPSRADEGAGVAGWFGIEAAEDLDD